MNEVFERIYELLDKKGIKAGTMCREIGMIPTTFYAGRDNDSIPRADNLGKIADYLGVTTDYLLTGNVGYDFDSHDQSVVQEDSFSYYTDPEVAKLVDELKNNTGMRVLLDASRDLTMEDLLEVIDFVNKMKKEDE